MAANPVDPLQALGAAIAVPANSKEQADLLATLRESLEAQPGPIPILCTTLFSRLVSAGDSLLRQWFLDLLHFAICRSTLSLEARTQLSAQSVDILAGLLNDPNPATVKVVVQCFTTVYPFLFRVLSSTRNPRSQWDTLTHCKARIIEFFWAPGTNSGVRLSAVKFIQRAILVQTRGISDPRLQNKNDPNLSSCPADHPFISAPALEAEGSKLLENVITVLYTSQNIDMISAILNSWASLTKLRPNLIQLIVSTLASWTPNALIGLPASSIKSVEKSVRILLNHIQNTVHGRPYAPQIGEALVRQQIRMERAAEDEKSRRISAAAAADAESRKRPLMVTTSTEEASDPKRQKLEQDGSAAALLAGFDFTSLPAALITELVVANLQAFTEPALIGLVQAYRTSRGMDVAPPAPSILAAGSSSEPAAPIVKEEPVDPLQMDIDEEELEYEPDRLNMELSGHEYAGDPVLLGTDPLTPSLDLVDFKLPPPKELSEPDRLQLVQKSIERIWINAQDGSVEMWMLLIVRMITRVTEPPEEKETEIEKVEEGKEGEEGGEVDFYARQDKLRQVLCDYIMADFPSRMRLATTWMNEEWYNDQIRLEKDHNWRSNYDAWLNQIVASYQALLDAKDRTFSRFLLDLPAVPTDVLGLLRDLCVDPDRMQVGFAALREFVVQRPSLRREALNVLLELTTHPEKVTRGAAIITVKRWVPGSDPIDGMVRDFALAMLRRLQSRDKPMRQDVQMNGGDSDENMEDGQLPPEDLVPSPYLPDSIELPAQKAQVLQHVELLFALSVKVTEFLEEIFTAYGQMDVTVQEAIQQLITQLIKSLGSSHGKLLTLMRACPPGSESLALRVLTIFTENGRPSTQLVALVKGLINERDLDARFLIPIIAEMDKPDIMRHLPRIVSILNGQTEPKNLVRSVFSSVVTTPPQTFGSVTSNLPRVRQSELLTPAELMVLLHESEKEIGLKSAIEAIGICFSMIDVFRSEILAVVMQQIVDEPVLPVLFMRTVIQAVTTYKSLVGFVSTTLLSRLITKKIWTNPPLWEGFIRCAKLIAPASFGALLQLPKDQLRELVDKQPSLKSGLRDYVMRKSGNKARVAGFLDIFGEENPAGGAVGGQGELSMEILAS